MKKIIRSIKDFIYEQGFWEALFALIFGVLMSPFLLIFLIVFLIDGFVRELCKPDD